MIVRILIFSVIDNVCKYFDTFNQFSMWKEGPAGNLTMVAGSQIKIDRENSMNE